MKHIFIKSGEIYFSKEKEALIETIVGSCIAICIFDREKQLSGICHYRLQTGDKSELSPVNENDYGNIAILNLLKKFKATGANPKNLEIKVIGGADIESNASFSQGDIGSQNIEIALKTISEFGLNVTAKSVGGDKGKKIRFNTKNGKVQLLELAEEMPRKKKGVLIIDDSPSIRKLLRRIIEGSDKFQVIGEAENPIIAKELIDKNRPDAITLDVNMPLMDGLTFLKTELSILSIPTIMISSLSPSESDIIFESLKHGAFDYIQKPNLKELDLLSKKLIDLLNAATSHKPIRVSEGRDSKDIEIPAHLGESLNSFLVVVGSSTGGIDALEELLKPLPKDYPPILIAQHIPKSFSGPFAKRLDSACKLKIQEAVDNQIVEPGNVYIAPGGMQMKVIQGKNEKLCIQVNDDPSMNNFKPSVDYLFGSIKDVTNKKVIAIMLTGMGSDGAKEMLQLKERGAYTIGQSEDSCTVYGMPRAAKEIGAIDIELDIKKIPQETISALKNKCKAA